MLRRSAQPDIVTLPIRTAAEQYGRCKLQPRARGTQAQRATMPDWEGWYGRGRENQWKPGRNLQTRTRLDMRPSIKRIVQWLPRVRIESAKWMARLLYEGLMRGGQRV